MRVKEGSVCLVTGASSGIGKAIADTLAAEGMRVYGTSRNPVTLPNAPVALLPLTLSDQASIEAAVAEIIAREGRIDCLVNNAGSGICGAIEETSPEKIREQLNSCFLGHVAVTQAVLPLMRQQGGGRIVFIGSVAAGLPIPYQAAYSAAKAALRAFAAALAGEVRQFGIEVSVVEPGDTKTGFTAGRTTETADHSPYAARMQKSVTRMERDEQAGHPPQKVAKAVCRVLRARHPKPRVTVGLSYKCFDLLRRCLPERWTNAIIHRMYG